MHSVFYHYYQPGLLDVNALYIGKCIPHLLGIDTVIDPSLDHMYEATSLGTAHARACRLALARATDKYGLP